MTTEPPADWGKLSPGRRAILSAEAKAWKRLEKFQAKEKLRRERYQRKETALMDDWSAKYSAVKRMESDCDKGTTSHE